MLGSRTKKEAVSGPVARSLIFLPAPVASFGVDFAGLGITPLTPPSNLAPPIIGVWMLIGVGLLV